MGLFKKKWAIVLDLELFGEGMDDKFKFADFRELKVSVGLDYLTDLGDVIEKNAHYERVPCIKGITSPEKEDFSSRLMYMIMATHRYDGTKVGFLFEAVDAHNLIIVGIWPDRFWSVCREQAMDGNNALILGMLDALVVSPKEWDSVGLYMTTKRA